MSLFRNEAIEAKRLRLWGEVRLAQPPSLTIWTVVLTLLCAVLATTLIFGRYTRKETVPGFLIPEAGVVQVRTVQSGRIARVLVRDGQAVAEGAPLIEFTSDIASIGQGPMLDVQLAETGHQEASLESRRAAVAQGYADDRRRLADQVAAHRRSRAILESQRRVQVEALALSEADAERLSQLQARGYAPAPRSTPGAAPFWRNAWPSPTSTAVCRSSTAPRLIFKVRWPLFLQGRPRTSPRSLGTDPAWRNGAPSLKWRAAMSSGLRSRARSRPYRRESACCRPARFPSSPSRPKARPWKLGCWCRRALRVF